MPRAFVLFQHRYKVSESGCWIWTGGSGHYGKIKIAGRDIWAHRYSYELHNGPIPAGLHIDHLCRVTRCVNPTHLEAVSGKVNTLRGDGPTAQNSRLLRCRRNHEFTVENTLISAGRRHCRSCARIRAKKYYWEAKKVA